MTDEGKAWLKYTQATMPRFWLLNAGVYYQRNLIQEIPLPASWPVEVNYLEAKAFVIGKQNHHKALCACQPKLSGKS